MSKFLNGTRVGFIGDDNYLKEGTIKQAFDDMQVATVLMDNGDLVKVKFSSLAILPEKTNQGETPSEATEPIEKSEITITPDEFKEKSVKVISKLSKEVNDSVLPMLGIMIISRVHRALFLEESEND